LGNVKQSSYLLIAWIAGQQVISLFLVLETFRTSQTGPAAPPTLSLPAVKWQVRGVDNTPPSNAEVKERV